MEKPERFTPRRAVLLLAIALGLALLFHLLGLMHYGIDLTDEGYYLQWIDHPRAYAESVTLFGFLYHPFYQWLNGDLVLLRQGNLLLTLGLSIWLAYGMLLPETSRRERIGIAFLLGLSAMMSYALWLPTPNYNSLNLQALLLAANGLVMVQRRPEWLWSWILLGLSGALTFLAKPTSALALAVVVVGYLLLRRLWKWRGVVATVCSGLGALVLSALLIDGSITRFIARLHTGALDALLMDEKAKPFIRFDSLSIGVLEATGMIVGLLLVFGTARLPARYGCALMYAALFFGFLVIAEMVPEFSAYRRMFGLIFWGPVLGAVLYRQWFPQPNLWPRALAIVFMLLPLVYCFGTNNNYWAASALTAVFWLLAAVALLPRHAFPIAVAGLLGTLLVLSMAISHPYRQSQPLTLLDARVTLPATGTELTVHPSSARYLTELSAALPVGTPVIDMTGVSPGALSAVGAVSKAAAWMIGGYSGSANLMHARLTRLSCTEIAESWILAEPGNRGRLPLDELPRYGIDLARYTKFGPFAVPLLTDAETPRMQFLYQPKAVNAGVRACEKVRG